MNKTTNRIELTSGDLVPQILAGYDLAADRETADSTGFTFGPKFRTMVAAALTHGECFT